MRENPGNPEYGGERDSIDYLNTQVFANSTNRLELNSRVPQYNPYIQAKPDLYETVKTATERESE